MQKKIFIWGAGGHGRVLLDILKDDKGIKVVGFIDENQKLKGQFIDGIEVLGDSSVLSKLKKDGVTGGIAGVGNNSLRQKMANEIVALGFDLISAIDKNALISKSVKLGKGITIWSGAIINSYANIEDNVIINCGAIIEHECLIKNSAHIGPGAKLAGRVCVGEKSFVGMGANIIEGKIIGNKTIIGAGATVLDNIIDGVVAVGSPAKIIKKSGEF